MSSSRSHGEPSRGLTELIGRALIDEGFRNELYRDRAAATREFQLTESDLEALETISKDQLESHARQFGSGAASAITISIVIKGHFWAPETGGQA